MDNYCILYLKYIYIATDMEVRVIPSNLSPKRVDRCEITDKLIIIMIKILYVRAIKSCNECMGTILYIFCSIRIPRIVWWFNYRAIGPWVCIVCATTVTAPAGRTNYYCWPVYSPPEFSAYILRNCNIYFGWCVKGEGETRLKKKHPN